MRNNKSSLAKIGVRGFIASVWLIGCLLGAASVYFDGTHVGQATSLAGNSSSTALASDVQPSEKFVAIERIRVGQRVLTDGGLANSPNGRAFSVSPPTTEVDPATWRLVEITAGDWRVTTLQPLVWLKSGHVEAGCTLQLSEVIDVAEMGAPPGLIGTVSAIAPCPQIQTGPGRIVLTTVSHPSDSVFRLTLKDGAGKVEQLGVTGTHRFYSEEHGWTAVKDLSPGETLRGDHGELSVVELSRALSADLVYNMTVEADHVYYVGDLPALVHNSCVNPANIEPHHLLPVQFKQQFQEAGFNINAWTIPMTAGEHRLSPGGLHTVSGGNWNAQWAQFFAANKKPAQMQILGQLAQMMQSFGI